MFAETWKWLSRASVVSLRWLLPADTCIKWAAVYSTTGFPYSNSRTLSGAGNTRGQVTAVETALRIGLSENRAGKTDSCPISLSKKGLFQEFSAFNLIDFFFFFRYNGENVGLRNKWQIIRRATFSCVHVHLFILLSMILLICTQSQRESVPGVINELINTYEYKKNFMVEASLSYKISYKWPDENSDISRMTTQSHSRRKMEKRRKGPAAQTSSAATQRRSRTEMMKNCI